MPPSRSKAHPHGVLIPFCICHSAADVSSLCDRLWPPRDGGLTITRLLHDVLFAEAVTGGRQSPRQNVGGTPRPAAEHKGMARECPDELARAILS